ncbi:MAG: ATP-binding protein [Rhodanobacteraceae bacterium]
MSRADEILAARPRLWDGHPIVTESAVLPTRAVMDATARVIRLARKTRASIAFWADPMTGKSSCLDAIARAIRSKFPGAGILRLEPVEDNGHAEGRLLEEILNALNYAPKIDRSLAGKRHQVARALLAWSGPAKHLFILVDEAQEFAISEFAWLKAIINEQAALGVKVTTVLIGQRELQRSKHDLEAKGRSDLSARFMHRLREFHGVRAEADMRAVCEALDQKSEYPVGSGWTYTEFFFPRASANGFRFIETAPMLWAAITAALPPTLVRKGLPMSLVAAMVANLCISCGSQDTAPFTLTIELSTGALKRALAE